MQQLSAAPGDDVTIGTTKPAERIGFCSSERLEVRESAQCVVEQLLRS